MTDDLQSVLLWSSLQIWPKVWRTDSGEYWHQDWSGAIKFLTGGLFVGRSMIMYLKVLSNNHKITSHRDTFYFYMIFSGGRWRSSWIKVNTILLLNRIFQIHLFHRCENKICRWSWGVEVSEDEARLETGLHQSSAVLSNVLSGSQRSGNVRTMVGCQCVTAVQTTPYKDPDNLSPVRSHEWETYTVKTCSGVIQKVFYIITCSLPTTNCHKSRVTNLNNEIKNKINN